MDKMRMFRAFELATSSLFDFLASLFARLVVMAAAGFGSLGLIPPANAICLMVGMAVFQYLFLAGQQSEGA